jgi:hypothetical protein
MGGGQVGGGPNNVIKCKNDKIKGRKNNNNNKEKLLDTINSFSQVSGYKINLKKSVAFVYTNDEQIEKNVVSKKKIKYLVINLTKDVNDLSKEN